MAIKEFLAVVKETETEWLVDSYKKDFTLYEVNLKFILAPKGDISIPSLVWYFNMLQKREYPQV